MKKLGLIAILCLVFPLVAQDDDLNIGGRATNGPSPILSEEIWERFGSDYFSIEIEVTDPSIEVAGIAEGLSLAGESDECLGMIAEDPTFAIQWERTEIDETLPMRFFVTGGEDATLLIYEPDGDWHCSDDYADTRHPYVEIDSLRSGFYKVWVGAKSTSDDFRARLYMSIGSHTPDDAPPSCCDGLSFSNPAQGGTSATIAYFEVDEWIDEETDVAGISISTDILFRGEGGTTFIVEAIVYDAETDEELPVDLVDNDTEFCGNSAYPCDFERIRRDSSRRDYSPSSRSGPITFNIPDLDLAGLGDEYYIEVVISAIDRDDNVEDDVDSVEIDVTSS